MVAGRNTGFGCHYGWLRRGSQYRLCLNGRSRRRVFHEHRVNIVRSEFVRKHFEQLGKHDRQFYIGFGHHKRSHWNDVQPNIFGYVRGPGEPTRGCPFP